MSYADLEHLVDEAPVLPKKSYSDVLASTSSKKQWDEDDSMNNDNSEDVSEFLNSD